MAGLLAAIRDALILGPKVGQVRPEERAWGDSLADLLERTMGRSYAGVPVTDDSALQLSAYWACVDLLAELVATLPVDEYRDDNGLAVPLPSSRFLSDPAGDGSGSEVWLRQQMTALLTRGNAYGFIAALDDQLRPSQILPLHPDQVVFRQERSFGPGEWLLDRKPIGLWPDGPLWHVAGYNVPGTPVGLSPVAYAKETVGLGLATRKFGSQWFGDGAHPTSVLESDQVIDADQAKILRDRINDAVYDNRRTLVLGAGLKLNQLQVAPDESQFLETSRANVADIARYFRVPPEMIGGDAGSSMTYATLEGRTLHLLTFAVNPWLVRLERSLSRLRPRGRFVKFNADALVRVDLGTRYRAHDSALRAGWKSRNEVRRTEDLPPIPDGDEYLWPPYSTAPATDPAPVDPNVSEVADEGAQSS